LEEAILKNETYIKSETLTDSLVFLDDLENGIEIEFDEIKTRIVINK
jgi:isoleucyl-tRNA synthetase